MQDYFMTGRETIYSGIKMRSRLEASWAAYLDAQCLAWEYEPICFASQYGQYLPDFRVTDSDGVVTYLEVKGAPPDWDTVRRRMEIIWDSEPKVRLAIAQGPPESPCEPQCFYSAAPSWQYGWTKDDWDPYGFGPVMVGGGERCWWIRRGDPSIYEVVDADGALNLVSL